MIDIVRPAVAPASLAEKKTYRGDDVYTALHGIFHGKCYLCETPVELGKFSVDHRKPKGQFPELEYAWGNLFPACNEFNCNGRRQKTYPDGGLLDPGEGIEAKVIQQVEHTVSMSLRGAGNISLIFRARDAADVSAENTARELDRIHNGTDSEATATASSLHTAICVHIAAIAPLVHDYAILAASSVADPVALDERCWRVTKLVSRRAPYAMLVRSYFSRLDAVRALFD